MRSRPAPGVLRVRLDLAYDGTDFAGWAVQPGQRTVQGELQDALTRVLRLDPAPVLTVAGRTDAGVHARGQVCHVDLPALAWARVPGRSSRSPEISLLTRLAGVLSADVRVFAVSQAPPDFDARFSAVSRRYAYRIADTDYGVDPLRRRDVLWHRGGLDLEAMNSAAALLLGEHDFTSFCRRRAGATTIRTLRRLTWSRDNTQLAVARVEADAFCHTMVRSLVGALVPVGEGKAAVDWPAQALADRSRGHGAAVVPPHGLTLEQVRYPPDAELAQRARAARTVRTLPAPTPHR